MCLESRFAMIQIDLSCAKQRHNDLKRLLEAVNAVNAVNAVVAGGAEGTVLRFSLSLLYVQIFLSLCCYSKLLLLESLVRWAC
jgi:hypothetical protein